MSRLFNACNPYNRLSFAWGIIEDETVVVVEELSLLPPEWIPLEEVAVVSRSLLVVPSKRIPVSGNLFISSKTGFELLSVVDNADNFEVLSSCEVEPVAVVSI